MPFHWCFLFLLSSLLEMPLIPMLRLTLRYWCHYYFRFIIYYYWYFRWLRHFFHFHYFLSRFSFTPLFTFDYYYWLLPFLSIFSDNADAAICHLLLFHYYYWHAIIYCIIDIITLLIDTLVWLHYLHYYIIIYIDITDFIIDAIIYCAIISDIFIFFHYFHIVPCFYFSFIYWFSCWLLFTPLLIIYIIIAAIIDIIYYFDYAIIDMMFIIIDYFLIWWFSSISDYAAINIDWFLIFAAAMLLIFAALLPLSLIFIIFRRAPSLIYWCHYWLLMPLISFLFDAIIFIDYWCQRHLFDLLPFLIFSYLSVYFLITFRFSFHTLLSLFLVIFVIFSDIL